MKKCLQRLFGTPEKQTPEYQTSKYREDKYVVRFFFEWGTTACIWCANERSFERYGGGAMDLDCFALSDGLKQTLSDMAQEFQSSIDWSEPQNPSPWSKEQQDVFMSRARAVHELICAELGDDHEVLFEITVGS